MTMNRTLRRQCDRWRRWQEIWRISRYMVKTIVAMRGLIVRHWWRLTWRRDCKRGNYIWHSFRLFGAVLPQRILHSHPGGHQGLCQGHRHCIEVTFILINRHTSRLHMLRQYFKMDAIYNITVASLVGTRALATGPAHDDIINMLRINLPLFLCLFEQLFGMCFWYLFLATLQIIYLFVE